MFSIKFHQDDKIQMYIDIYVNINNISWKHKDS